MLQLRLLKLVIRAFSIFVGCGGLGLLLAGLLLIISGRYDLGFPFIMSGAGCVTGLKGMSKVVMMFNEMM